MNNNIKVKNPVWYLLTPFLARIAASYLVQMCFSAAFLGRMNIPRNLAYGSKEMIELVQKLTEKMIAYNTQITTATNLLLLPLVAWMFRRDVRRRLANGFAGLKKASVSKYAALVPLGVVACVVSNNIISMSQLALYSDEYQKVNASLYSASFPVMLVGLGMIVPAAEELMFRGVLYNRIKDLASQRMAWVLSSLLFGLYHGNLVQGIYGFLAGMLLVYVYEKFGSMWAPAITHMVLNITSVCVSKTGVFTWLFQDMMRVCVVTVAGGALLGFCLLFLVRMESGQEETEENPGTEN